MGLILGVCFMVICFMYYATCKKMSAEINDLRKKADDYYDAICLLKEECNSIGQSVQQGTVDNVDNSVYNSIFQQIRHFSLWITRA